MQIVYANPAYRFMIPNVAQDPVGLPYDKVWPPAGGSGYNQQVRHVFETGIPFQKSGIERIYPDRTRRVFSFQARRIQWDRQSACLLILWDITDLKKTEEALLESQAAVKVAEKETEKSLSLIQAIADHLSEGVVVTDARGDILIANQALLTITGFEIIPPEQFQEYSDRMEWSDAQGRAVPHDERPLARVLRGETIRDEEYRVRNRDTGLTYTARLQRLANLRQQRPYGSGCSNLPRYHQGGSILRARIEKVSGMIPRRSGLRFGKMSQ